MIRRRFPLSRRDLLAGGIGGAFAGAATRAPALAGDSVAQRSPADTEAATFQLRSTGARPRTLQDKLAEAYLSVRDFGATGAAAQDATDAIQAAVDAACLRGGTVFFPSSQGEQYLVTRTIAVRSRYPVHIVSEMSGQFFDPAVPACAILVGANMDYVIEYSAPNAAERGAHGGGSIRGIAFVDPTARGGGRPGRHVIVAALHLKDFVLGTVENCCFHFLAGGAVRTEFAVMATIKECRARYSGRADAAVWELAGFSSLYPTQSFIFENNRTEVCYSRSYLAAGENVLNVTIRGCAFEAAPQEYPESSGNFLRLGCSLFLVDGCGFNRTGAVAVEITRTGSGQVIGCTFATGSAPAPSLTIAGARNIVANCLFEDNRSDLSVLVSGVQNVLIGNIFYLSGGVHFSGARNSFQSNRVNGSTRSAGFWLTLAGWAMVEGNVFDDNGSAPAGGAIVTFESDRILNNFFDRWAGQVAIRRESANSVIHGNSFGAVGEAYSQSVEPRPGTGFTVNGAVFDGRQH